MDRTPFAQHVDIATFVQLRSFGVKLGLEDYIVLLLLLIGAVGYVTHGRIWAKSDPYLYKLYERPQELFGTITRDDRNRDIAQRLSQENKDAVIFWGSQSGTAEGFANRLARDCNRRFGMNVIVADLSDYDPDTIAQITDDKIVMFLLSTYGEGDPSDNATEFLDWIRKRSEPVPHIRYAAFGLGNSTYVYYNKVVEDVVQCLDRLFATPLLPVGKADDANSGTEEDFVCWRDDLFSMFQYKLGLETHVASYVPTISISELSDSAQSSLQSGEPLPLRLPRKTARDYSTVQKLPVKTVRALTGAGSTGRGCLHLEIDIRAHAQIKYKTGDHLAVWPTNSSGEVERLVAVLGLSQKREKLVSVAAVNAEDELRIPKHTTIAALFRHYLEISAPVSRDTISNLAHLAPTNTIKLCLQNLSTKSAYATFVSQHHLTFGRLLEYALLRDTSANWHQLPLAFVIESLRPMAPRYYSISSSSMTSPRQMSITVAISTSELLTNPAICIAGLSTSYLSSLDTNETPSIYSHVRRSTFKMPFLHKTPIVLVAAGTGIAPFRGFLQERAQMTQISNKEIGPVLLLFGCRSPDQDYLYNTEIEELQNGPLKTKLEVVSAFSRVPGQKKCFVQDRLAEQDVKERVVRMLCEQEGNLYFCGSTIMAKTAGRAVVNAVKEYQRINDADAKAWMDSMKRGRRWQEDVWG